MSEYFRKPKYLGGKLKVELDLSKYARKSDLKNATGINISKFAKKTDLVNSKSEVDKLNIDKFKDIPSGLSNLKRKPNEHIFVDSPSIRRRISTWIARRDFIDFKRRIHAEIMTSIQRGHFDVDSTFKIDEISMSSPRGIFLCRFNVELT